MVFLQVMEQATDAEKGMTVREFLDYKRRNKVLFYFLCHRLIYRSHDISPKYILPKYVIHVTDVNMICFLESSFLGSGGVGCKVD